MKELKRTDNQKFSEQEASEFLITEYNQSFEQMRHYHSTQNSLITFSLTGYIAVFTATFALYQSKSGGSIKYLFILLIFLLSFIVGLTILTAFVRNRIYFTIVAQQVNSIRNYFLCNSTLDFILYNKGYLRHDRPRNFNPISPYSIYIYVISLFNSSLLSSGIILLTHFIFQLAVGSSIIWGIVFGFVSFTIQLYMTIKCFKNKDKQRADDAVWGG
ncbi:hypothetical protein Tfer_3283 [Thermincola ferriacetica]|uniref:Uncharacterized protein n=1 Tax=Thermincola ferriacetica TaxID=281456 RepID=A0A0L6VY95_9FIRM|nr:hypothetical protein [Thermincola ferriacetica]KNZ68181.1 hypothetical protein Tfer_3283 [Thermincola ferriacetica]